MNNSDKYWLLVPAAGIGSRMGAALPKQYLKIAGRSILQWTLARLSQVPNIEKICLILNPNDQYWKELSSEITQDEKILTAEGGSERFESVMNGLNAIKSMAKGNDWVLVHDVVRPCVRVTDIEKLMCAIDDGCVGGLLANKVRETLKLSKQGSVVDETVNRDYYWLGGTPQMFRFDALYNAMTNAIEKGQKVTDEAMAMESMGHQVSLVEGQTDNIKVTHPADLNLVEFILKQQEGL